MVLQWPKVVEGVVADKTQALKFERNVLFVEVLNSAWASELRFLKEKILEKMNNNLGKKIVRDIRFLVRDRSQACHYKKGANNGKRNR